MPDLICLIPNHGYAEDAPVYVSWLSGNYFVYDSDVATSNKTFKLVENIGGPAVQFVSSVVDGFVRFDDQESVAVISGLDHLEGKIVAVTSGGEFFGSFEVINGEVTLTSELTTYQVGLPYTCKVRTTRLASPQSGNALQSQVKRINRTTLRHSKTQGGQIGQEAMVRDNTGNLNMTEFMEDLDAVFDTDSRDISKSIPGPVSPDAYTTIKSEVPSPMTIISAVIEFSVEEQR